MTKFIIISVVSGLILGVIDFLFSNEDLSEGLSGFFRQFSESAREAAACIGINLALGFGMTGIFLLMKKSLPGFVIVMGFALAVWFFRVMMFFIRQWMTFKASANDLAYVFIAGVSQMITLGILYDLTLKPLSQ